MSTTGATKLVTTTDLVEKPKAQETQVVAKKVETPVAETQPTEKEVKPLGQASKTDEVVLTAETKQEKPKVKTTERPELATPGIVAEDSHDGASAKLVQAKTTDEPKTEAETVGQERRRDEAEEPKKAEVVEGEKKEEGGFWNGVKNFVTSGTGIGLITGAAAELIHGDKDASLLERVGNVALSAANGYTNRPLDDKMEEAGVSKTVRVLSQAAGDFAWAWQNSGSSASFVGKLADLGVTTGVKWGAGKAFEAITNRTDNPTIRALAGVGLTIGSNWLGHKIGAGEWIDKKLGMGDIGKEKRTLEARDEFKEEWIKEGKPQGYKFWKGYTEKEIAHLEAKAKIKRGDEREELEKTAKALRANLKSVNSEDIFNAIHGDKTQLARLQAGEKVDISSVKKEKVAATNTTESAGSPSGDALLNRIIEVAKQKGYTGSDKAARWKISGGEWSTKPAPSDLNHYAVPARKLLYAAKEDGRLPNIPVSEREAGLPSGQKEILAKAVEEVLGPDNTAMA